MKNYFTLIFCSFIFFSINAQTVSTITGGDCTDGLAQDHLGNIYCSDWGGNIVYRIDSLGNSSIFKGGFVNPNGIAVDDTNQVYVCDHTDNRVEKYDQSGNLIRNYTGFNSPAGIKRLPNSDSFIVVEYNTGRIKILQPNGTVTLKHTGLPLNGPAGIAIIDTAVYIANFNDRRIYSYVNDSLHFIAQLPSHPGNFNFLGFLTALNGKLYATHISGNRIYEIDPSSGLMSVFAGNGTSGTQDGAIGIATFKQPNGILADTVNDILYISEAGSKNLRVISNLAVSLPELENSLSNFSLFPNPVDYQLNILLPDQSTKSFTLNIYDQLGREIYSDEKTFINRKVTIQIDHAIFSPGNYAISLKSGNTIATKLFIKN